MFEPRMLSSGHVCCSRQDALCDECTAHFAAAQTDDDDIPEPYALRAAVSAPDHAEQFRTIEAEAAEIADDLSDSLRRLALEPSDLATYEPPDGYAAGLRQLRKEHR